MGHAEFGGQLLADLVDPGGVLVGADGQGGGEPVEAVLGRILGSPAHPQPVTGGAAAAPLGLVLQAPGGLVEFPGVVAVLHHRHPQRMGLRHEPLQLLFPPVVFGVGPDVGVVVQNGDLEVLAQLLQHRAGTGPAAGVEKEPGPPAVQPAQHSVHLPGIIGYIGHCNLTSTNSITQAPPGRKGGLHPMTQEKIARINQLARKSKTPAGLTEAEKAEQQALRQEYLAEIRRSFRAQLENTMIQEPDGTLHHLPRRPGPENKN